ncbi:uncharacterized protein LOC142325051 [Lycorma delicatula]|uniref:uncharacterized protein LOC142325051 n=1 Tax=Lycorma delicatula TaxID=130591 RepID=UPI003F5107AB
MVSLLKQLKHKFFTKMSNPGVKGCGCAGSTSKFISVPSSPLSSGPPPNIPTPVIGQSFQLPSQPQPQPLPTQISSHLASEISDPSQTTDICEQKRREAAEAAQRAKEEKEAKEDELKKWVSPLRQFDTFATGELRRRAIAEEDFPRLKVPQMKGHHRCKVSCLLNHNVDYAVDMEQELRNIGIQQTFMLDMLEKLTKAEAACRFQGAVRAAEVAAMSAPPELAEEAAVAGARGYTVETQEFSKKSSPGENPIEIIGYIGCTRPNNF